MQILHFTNHPGTILNANQVASYINQTNQNNISTESIDNNLQNNKTYYGFNNDLYEINIVNINPITDAGDTKGGFSIYIKTLASFRLRFNYRDTIGSIIGFRYVGDPNSVTKYSGIENNFIRFNLTIYINC